MKHLIVASLLLVCSLQRGAHAQTGLQTLRTWPPVGAWATMLVRLPNAGVECWTMTRGPQFGGPKDWTIGFTMSKTDVHLDIVYHGPLVPSPTSANVSVDGRPVINLPVLKNGSNAAYGNNTLVADVPGQTFSRNVIPQLERGDLMRVDVGGRSFTASAAQFGTVKGQIVGCAQAAASTN